MTTLTEADVEDAALEWLAAFGWQTAHGPDIAPGALGEERADYGAVVLGRRLRDALARLNPDLPSDALDDAFRKLTRPEGSTLEARNRAFHRMLVGASLIPQRDALLPRLLLAEVRPGGTRTIPERTSSEGLTRT